MGLVTVVSRSHSSAVVGDDCCRLYPVVLGIQSGAGSGQTMASDRLVARAKPCPHPGINRHDPAPAIPRIFGDYATRVSPLGRFILFDHGEDIISVGLLPGLCANFQLADRDPFSPRLIQLLLIREATKPASLPKEVHQATCDSTH